jgi:hypothetical protein
MKIYSGLSVAQGCIDDPHVQELPDSRVSDNRGLSAIYTGGVWDSSPLTINSMIQAEFEALYS